MVNSMFMHSKLPINLWAKLLLIACHIHIRISSKKTRKSPYESLKGRKPNLSYIKVWGCIAYYRVNYPKRTKLGPRALKSNFVGYAQNSKAYRLLNLESNVIIESRDNDFLESSFLYDSNKTSDNQNNTAKDDNYGSGYLNKR